MDSGRSSEGAGFPDPGRDRFLVGVPGVVFSKFVACLLPSMSEVRRYR
jgi:hypothetical protein